MILVYSRVGAGAGPGTLIPGAVLGHHLRHKIPFFSSFGGRRPPKVAPRTPRGSEIENVDASCCHFTTFSLTENDILLSRFPFPNCYTLPSQFAHQNFHDGFRKPSAHHRACQQSKQIFFRMSHVGSTSLLVRRSSRKRSQ